MSTQISLQQSEGILKRSKINGSAFEDKSLTMQDLEKLDLLPKYLVKVDDIEIYLSLPFFAEFRSENAFIAFIKDKKSFNISTYFYSRSQAVLRLLRGYRFIDKAQKQIWNDKGYSEESLLLPFQIQKLAAELSSLEPLHIKNSISVFYGTCYEQPYEDDYSKEVNKNPAILNEAFIPKEKDDKVDPRLLILSKELSPDFTKCVANWNFKTDHYRGINAYVYRSYDNKFYYLFYEDEIGRVWIAGVNKSSVITTLGVGMEWVKAGDLTTPAWEYFTLDTDQTGGYGNPELNKGPYVDMYKNYLSKIPVIKDFKRFLN